MMKKKFALKLLSGKTVFISPQNISLCMSKAGRCTTVVLGDGTKLTAPKELNKVEAVLRPYSFFKIHQSCIVNLSCIKELKNRVLFLENGAEVTIARARLQDFLDLFSRI